MPDLLYDVALSFAGGDRHLVFPIADKLKSFGIRVFYDEYEQATLWGKDLYLHLHEIYGSMSRYCIIFASRAYRDSVWTSHERRAAQERALLEKDREYILPIKIDDTLIPGMPATIGYVDIMIGSDLICQFIIEKLRAESARDSVSSNLISSTIIANHQRDDISAYLAWLVRHIESDTQVWLSMISNANSFSTIRQKLRLVERAIPWEDWLAREREWRRADAISLIDDIKRRGSALAMVHDARDELKKHNSDTLVFSYDCTALTGLSIVLGDPGSGKSSLLRFEALRLAKDALCRLPQVHDNRSLHLPILIRLPELNAFLRDTLRDQVSSGDPMMNAIISLVWPAAPATFRHLLRAYIVDGRVSILLDGWDEVSDYNEQTLEPGSRSYLAWRLRQFTERNNRVRVVLSSRIVGYRSGPGLLNSREFTLLPFERSDISSFVLSAFADRRAARQFLAWIDKNEQISRLASIPLLLTLMTRAAINDKTFFRRRSQVFAWCIQQLLRNRLFNRDTIQDEINVSSFMHLVGELSLHLSRTSVHVNWTFDGTVFSDFCQTWQNALAIGHPLRAERIDRILKTLLRTSLLISDTTDDTGRFSFLHRAFQEYLAAEELARLQSKGGWQKLRPIVDRMSWDPDCEEILIIFSGLIADARPLVKMLADPATDDLLRHRLAIALRVINEIGSDFRQQHDQLCEEAFDTWVQFAPLEGGARKSCVRHLERALCITGLAARDCSGLFSWLQHEEPQKRYAAVYVMNTFGAGMQTNPLARKLLFQAAADMRSPEKETEDRSLMDHANDTAPVVLAQFGEHLLGDAVLRSQMLRALAATEASGPNIRAASCVAYTLGLLKEFTANDEELRGSLVQVILDKRSVAITWAVEAFVLLGSSVARYPEVRAALVSFLRIRPTYDRPAEDWYAVHRSIAEVSAVYALGRQGKEAAADPDVFAVLIEVLHDDRRRHPNIFEAAAIAVGRLARDSEDSERAREVAGVLITALESRRGLDDGARGIGYVYSLLPSKDEVRARLMTWLADGEGYLSRMAALAVGEARDALAGDLELGLAIARVLERDSSARGSFPRQAAAWALWRLGSTVVRQSAVRAALLRGLGNPEFLWGNDTNGAARALGCLADLARHDIDLRQTLLSYLTSDSDRVRLNAAEAFVALAPAFVDDLPVQQALFFAMEHDEFHLVQTTATQALVKMDLHDDDLARVEARLTARLTSTDEFLPFRLAAQLSAKSFPGLSLRSVILDICLRPPPAWWQRSSARSRALELLATWVDRGNRVFRSGGGLWQWRQTADLSSWKG